MERLTSALKTGRDRMARTFDSVLPPRCALTGDIVDRQGMLAPAVWRDLSFIGDPLCACCGFPFDFPVGNGAVLCAACLAERPVFESARAALAYDDHSRGLLLRFKHADQTHTLATFVPWLRRAGAQMLAEADVLVPVPLHRLRLLRRRYNQAALLAGALARECSLPWLPEALRRERATPSQGHLNAQARRSNVRGAFSADPRFAPLLGKKTVVLVDDVFTTGATASECARILHQAGARAVHVLAIARVVRTS